MTVRDRAVQKGQKRRRGKMRWHEECQARSGVTRPDKQPNVDEVQYMLRVGRVGRGCWEGSGAPQRCRFTSIRNLSGHPPSVTLRCMLPNKAETC